MELFRDNDQTIRIRQTGYIERILRRFGMDQCKPVSCPAEPSLRLSKEMSGEEHDMSRVPYREAVGVFNYLAVSRPHIAFSVSQVARFCERPSMTHWNALKRVMRYLKGTDEYSLTFGGKQLTRRIFG